MWMRYSVTVGELEATEKSDAALKCHELKGLREALTDRNSYAVRHDISPRHCDGRLFH